MIWQISSSPFSPWLHHTQAGWFSNQCGLPSQQQSSLN